MKILLLLPMLFAQFVLAAMDRSEDEKEVRKIVEANFAASNVRDAEAVAATFWPGANAWITGIGMLGENIEEAEGDFYKIPGFQNWDGMIDTVRFISADAAIVETTCITTLNTGEYEEKTTIVVSRNDGVWKLAAWRVMEFDESLAKMMRDKR